MQSLLRRWSAFWRQKADHLQPSDRECSLVAQLSIACTEQACLCPSRSAPLRTIFPDQSRREQRCLKIYMFSISVQVCKGAKRHMHVARAELHEERRCTSRLQLSQSACQWLLWPRRGAAWLLCGRSEPAQSHFAGLPPTGVGAEGESAGTSHLQWDNNSQSNNNERATVSVSDIVQGALQMQLMGC